jgi:putative endonuclease
MKRAADKTSGSSSKPKTARQGLGRTGERLATEELERRGYHILECNFRGMRGEIDIIAEDARAGDLVFVEVKTRRGNAYGLPEEAITFRKRQKLLQVAAYYLDQYEQADRSWRIDVVAIQMSQLGKLEEIRIYEHAVTGEM